MTPLPMAPRGQPPPPPPPFEVPPLAMAGRVGAPLAANPPAPVGPGPLRNPAEAYRRLEAIYAEVDRRITALGPTCNARGLCCDFDRVDHVLYASKLEVDYVKDHLPEARWGRPTGNVCPLLDDAGHCSARGVRMLGCRTYFCQQGWEPYGAEIYEDAYREIKKIALAWDLDWAYDGALRQMGSAPDDGPR